MYSRNTQVMKITNVMDGCDFTSATTHLIISFIGQLHITEIDFGLFYYFLMYPKVVTLPLPTMFLFDPI
jgi:hypothetical protein